MGGISLFISVASAQYVLHAAKVPAYDWSLDLVLTGGIAAVAVLLGAWLALWSLISAICVAGAALGHRSRRLEGLIAVRGPALIRRLVATAIGVGLTVTAGPAFAASDDASGSSSSSTNLSGQPTAITGLAWQNTSPASGAEGAGVPSSSVPVTSSQEAPAEETVVVQSGDSLWRIAAQHLPDGATRGEVTAAWPKWYDLNSDIIGADPGLILPGQELLKPAGNY